MALVDAQIWQTYTGITVTGVQLVAVDAICAAVSAAVKKEIRREIERREYAGMILAAPPTPQLQLFRYAPIVIETLEVYLDPYARGDPALLEDEDNLLVMYGQNGYTLTPDPLDPTLCSNGVLTRCNGLWGLGGYMPPRALRPAVIPVPGAILINMEAGFETVPLDLQLAAVTMTTKVWRGVKWGGQYTSESWNGYSGTIPAAAIAALQDPAVSMILDLYRNYADMV